MDKKQAIELVKKYKDLVTEKFPVKCMYLFGSYSKGNYHEESDIDVAVIVDNMTDELFDEQYKLWTLRRKVSLLIEPVMLEADEGNPLYYDIVRTGTLI